LGIFGSVAQWERELISSRTKRGLEELKKTKKLGNPQNLTSAARMKGVEAVKINKIENENWKRAKTFVEHFQMKFGYINLSELSRELNENGYKTQNGCLFSTGTVKRLISL
jgi:hypothetical protein